MTMLTGNLASGYSKLKKDQNATYELHSERRGFPFSDKVLNSHVNV